MEDEKIKYVEIKNFLKVWIAVFLSLTYCYSISSKIKKGKLRLLSILPIISIFLFLPLNLTSVHLGGTTSFFIAWLANFKLLLFAFDLGPLSSDPSISLLRFISMACFPIKIQQTQKDPQIISHKNSKSTLNYAIKGLMLAFIIRLYDYKQQIHPNLLLFLYCFHIYFALEIILALVATLARSLLGFELEPQFNEPLLSTSLQDFWGKRWNLMVTSILRPTVYEPVRRISTRMLGRKLAMVPAVLATFVVSGLMHELIFFYIGRVWPTWEVMCFFVLHGVCLVMEIGLKKVFKDRCRLHRAVSGPLTIGFVVVTGFWLFFPQFTRCGADVRGIGEYAMMAEFVKDMLRSTRVALGRIGVLSA